jgi:putative transposase
LRRWVDPEDPHLSVARQCELLGLARSTYYYEPAVESEEDLALMRRIDEQYLKTPFYGSRRMAVELSTPGAPVNRKRVQRLMRTMGIEALYPRRRTSQPSPEHAVYPYLLRGLTIDRANQVWCADITYLPLRRGFLYLTAVMDWHSRFVLAWRVSNTLDAAFCVAALEASLERGRPEIFNTDQGSQFTSQAFTSVLLEARVAISMDGRGRALDNVFIERLWRTVKYEEVYLKDYATVADVMEGLTGYFEFYDYERKHQALGYRTPHEVFSTSLAGGAARRRGG